MLKKYPPLNEQIKEFGIYRLYGRTGKLIPEHFITCKEDYNHDFYNLHHYIKEQQYYRYPEKYAGKQKLILLPVKLHEDLHSAMSEERFFSRYGVSKDLLIWKAR